MNDCAYGAELHFLKMRDLPVAKSVFPDVDYAPIAEAFGFQAATIRSLDDLHKLAPLLARPDGPLFLDCKLLAIAWLKPMIPNQSRAAFAPAHLI
jgi:acetolactate synthase-1/2/3 large subunit